MPPTPSAPAAARAAVACRDGCAACCQVPVDVQAHEVLFAADHIQLHFAPQALADGSGVYDALGEGFTLLALGACHAPHQAPMELIRSYDKHFAHGWDIERARRLARQIQMGLVPAGTELPPRNTVTK